MKSRNNEVAILDTETVLEHAEKRLDASQFLLLAIVDKEARTTEEIRISLDSCLLQLKKTARNDFYFDLGWLENLNTILDNFISLNWVEKHHSATTYGSTKIGSAQLDEKWRLLQSYLGMSLSEFQDIC